MKRALLVLLTACLLPCMSGCFPLLIGAAAGGLGAYAVSNDTVEGDSDKNFDMLWDSALATARRYGNVDTENISTGHIEVSFESSKLWIRLIRLTRATTRVRVSARKHHFPDIKLAQDVFVKIISGVK
ncbi:MAG: DUF3568 family protein [Candidatus Omnitrophota bacterium]